MSMTSERRRDSWAVVCDGVVWWWAKTEREAAAYIAGWEAAHREVDVNPIETGR